MNEIETFRKNLDKKEENEFIDLISEYIEVYKSKNVSLIGLKGFCIFETQNKDVHGNAHES